MSRRPSAVVTYRIAADPGEPPNRYVGQVSAHFRMSWPPGATDEQITEVLDEAHSALAEEIERARRAWDR